MNRRPRVIVAFSLAAVAFIAGRTAIAAGPAKPAPGRDFQTTREPQFNPQPSKGEQGALWESNLEPGDFVQKKKSLHGRPSEFAVTRTNIVTPFANQLLVRDWDSGLFEPSAVRFPDLVDQVVASGRQLACTMKIEMSSTETIGEIVLLTNRGEVKRLVGHRIPPWRLQFSPSGDRLLSCCHDQTTRLWDTQTGKEIGQFLSYGIGGGSGPRGEFTAFSADGSRFANIVDGDLAIRRSVDGAELTRWQLPATLLGRQAVRFASDGKSVFVFNDKRSAPRGKEGVFYQCVTKGERDIVQWQVDAPAVDGLFSLDGEKIITWSIGPFVCIVATKERKQIAKLTAAPKEVYCAALVPGRSVLATVGDDEVVKFWDLDKNCQLKTQQEYRHEECDEVAFSPDGRYLITTSNQVRLRVWKTPDFAQAAGK